MRHVPRQLPFRDTQSSLAVAGEDVPIRAFQIVVWVSLSIQDGLAKDAKQFPAVLDTGHTHNFSIRASQLLTWARILPDSLAGLGGIVVNRDEVPLRMANRGFIATGRGRRNFFRGPSAWRFPRGSPFTLPGSPPRLGYPCWACGGWSEANCG